MTLFTRTLESPAHTKRQFVKAQHLLVLEGSLSLCDYLRQMGERSAFIVAEVLDEQDWVPFEGRYVSTGRAPYFPRSMICFSYTNILTRSSLVIELFPYRLISIKNTT
ncbi:hypothetical protein [Photorhabdus akhurstii]|uniref:hypothetical protein n=1 Tax=Photorhabdus akhurstii TaxID=171438 RepID=UPI002157EC6E